jgi:hypothetical protein
MQLWRRLRILKRNLTRSPQLERELDDEIQSYRQLLEDEKTAGGADPARARREALLELGGAAQIQEQVRDVEGGAVAVQSIAGVAVETEKAALETRKTMDQVVRVAQALTSSLARFKLAT